MFEGYEKFKLDVKKITDIDLNAYKERQMKRRIDALITKNHYSSYDEYVNELKRNSALLEEFVNYLTINVSEFYRNPEQWKILEQEVLPMLMEQSSGSLKIWSAACSTGDEPYSLVMLLSKFMPLSKIKIIATDIDKQVLQKAKSGLYYEKFVKGLPKEFADKYFTKVGTNTVQIADEIKACVEFKQHDMLKDAYPTNCDLIICRNVMIYFTEEAKNEIYKKFHNALKPKGVLFVGSTEQMIQSKEFGYDTLKSFFYQKK
ncbi:chemotaxis protein methyltransferase CheR [Lachnospiraceae bacterium KM106-2]|nr:chemotaxis protein methyltransferase CheR [Lachnospiraceae bacterium KM106-2]